MDLILDWSGDVYTGWLLIYLSDPDLHKVLKAYCPLWEDITPYTVIVPYKS